MIDGISFHPSSFVQQCNLYILERVSQYYHIAAVGSGVGKMVGSEVGDTE
jgi:hypothetical protein